MPFWKIAWRNMEQRGLASALTALSMALGSPFEVTGAAHLPEKLDGEGARTLIRIEGFTVSIDYRLGELKRLLKRFGAAEVVEGDAAAALWQSVRDATWLAEPRDRAVWVRRRVKRRPSDASLSRLGVGISLP